MHNKLYPQGVWVCWNVSYRISIFVKFEDILAAQEFAADYLGQEEIIFASGSRL